MPKVTVDGVEIEVPQGATKRRGDMIALSNCLRAACLIAAASSGLQPAIAQKVGATASTDLRPILAKIGTCMAEHQAKAVDTWLNFLPGSGAEDKFVMTQEGALTVCMEGGSIQTRGKLAYVTGDLRPYVATAAAVRAARVASATLNLGNASKPWFEQALSKLPQDGAFDKRAIVQQDFGHCVVIGNWRASRDFILSRSGSDAENASFAALVPLLGPCVSQGAQVAITKPMVRQAVSEPFYHLAQAATIAAGASR